METVPADQPQDHPSRHPAIDTFDHASSEPMADGSRYTLWPLVGPSELWSRDDMRAACARRDVAAVYRALNLAGISQRKIAARTGQSQSEIHEILHGRRVRSVELLEQIADGLGCPRSWWGLSYDAASAGYMSESICRATGSSADGQQPAADASLTVQVAIVFDALANN